MEERPEIETTNERPEVAGFPLASGGLGQPVANCQGSRGAQLQPWRCFWPPASGSDAHRKLLAEHPEVLTWRFDITQPFDRPWRLWTDSAPIEGTGPLACPLSPNWRCDVRPENGQPIASAMPEDVRRRRQELDAQLHNLNLQAVQPDTFHYLAPHQAYQTEKPYKCQLPKECFPSCKMHNLASESYRVSIANVTSHEHLFSLAVSGFEFSKCPVTIPDWSDHYMSSDYLPKLVEWLKGRLDCRDVFCYAYNVRAHI